MTAAVIALALASVVLLVIAAALGLAYWGSLLHIAELEDVVRAKCAELDALSIAGPPVDTATGSHDALPIRDDIRQVLTDYCEGMWRHTANGDTK